MTIIARGNDKCVELFMIFSMTQAAHATKIACNSRKLKLHHLNQPLLHVLPSRP